MKNVVERSSKLFYLSHRPFCLKPNLCKRNVTQLCCNQTACALYSHSLCTGRKEAVLSVFNTGDLPGFKETPIRNDHLCPRVCRGTKTTHDASSKHLRRIMYTATDFATSLSRYEVEEKKKQMSFERHASL